MATRRTNRGATIDFDSLIAKAPKHSPAVGNMRVNAQGDLLGPGGEVVTKSEDRVRKQYQDQPRSATQQVSLKGANTLKPDADVSGGPQVKTAATAQENTRTQAAEPKPEPAPEPAPAPVAEPEEFDAPEDLEPVSYREVELPNGDIEMVPVYKSDGE